MSLITHYSFFLFAFGIFAGANRANGQSQSDVATASPALQSPAPKQGLNFVVGPRGLESLSFNGQSLLRSPQSGELQPSKSVFRAALDLLLPRTRSPATTANKQTNSIELAYRWGRVSCAYGKQGDKITMRIEVSNADAKEIDELSLRLMELNFPSVRGGGTLEAGMFGFGFKDTASSLHQYPSVPSIADPQFVVPIVRVDYGTGALNFCSDDLECSVDVSHSTNPPTNTSFPFMITCHDIKPGINKTFNVSLRFGPAGSRVQDLSRDVLERYAKKYPFQINWNDRRPIGAIFLASSGINVPTNPRRWIMNEGKIDITTDLGRGAFRTALLKLADDSIKVLRDANAQGVITWDPEGQEFLASCYYGDPRLTPVLAPETEFKDDRGITAIDEYFEKFRRAGLKVGVCLRPQQITMVDGKPVHDAADDHHAAQVLKDKLAYAKKRWGCTLFYIDSTVRVTNDSLNPDVFKAVADAHPDVLLIPENESMRYFAYSAPLNSYVHHKVTSTPVGARTVYPKAFSVLMAPDGDRPEDHDALVNAVRNGDILLFNGWYSDEGVRKIKKLYQEATLGNADSTPQRGSNNELFTIIWR
ncbi:MAG: hypothetical protein DME66_08400 [Verrucomicrobia bacterium]|nr:MAG: hypothetical protein DME66_08400 [Verrucomicrobiota bacterium]